MDYFSSPLLYTIVVYTMEIIITSVAVVISANKIVNHYFSVKEKIHKSGENQ